MSGPITWWTIVYCDSLDPIGPLEGNPDPSDIGVLAFRTYEGAESAAKWHKEYYGVDCEPAELNRIT